MLKKLITTSAFSLLTVIAFAQTIVSTTPENKKVILEEFTGINCQFCPDGHAIAQSIQDANPGNVFLVNIHTGGFANPNGNQPDFRTPFGAAIAGQANVAGYPAGTVNRHFFPGQSQAGGTAMSRNQWPSASNQTLGEAAYLNLGVEAEIDVQANELTVHVEVFYTGNSPLSTNKLNVALLQNNTLGPQSGGGQGNNYVHMHRLVHMVTGQWGIDINNTTTGSFIDETFTYTIPADYNNIPVVLEDLEIVAFVTESTQEIISGNGTYPTYTNLPFNNDAAIASDAEFGDQCGIDFGPTATIQNRGNNPLTSLAIEYSINGGTVETYNWSGNLGPYQSEEVQLDPIPYNIQSNNTVEMSIPNDEDNSNNVATNTFSDITTQNTGDLNLRINCDADGDEITWAIVDVDGNTVESGGPYPPNEAVNIDIGMPAEGCYKFILSDSGNNGQYFVRLMDSDDQIIVLLAPGFNFGSEFSQSYRSDATLSVGDNNLNAFALYPNPTNSELNISGVGNADIAIYNVLGSTVMTVNGVTDRVSLDVSKLQAGTYFVKVVNEAGTLTKKFVVNR